MSYAALKGKLPQISLLPSIGKDNLFKNVVLSLTVNLVELMKTKQRPFTFFMIRMLLIFAIITLTFNLFTALIIFPLFQPATISFPVWIEIPGYPTPQQFATAYELSQQQLRVLTIIGALFGGLIGAILSLLLFRKNNQASFTSSLLIGLIIGSGMGTLFFSISARMQLIHLSMQVFAAPFQYFNGRGLLANYEFLNLDLYYFHILMIFLAFAALANIPKRAKNSPLLYYKYHR